ncbi:hypothetical protein M514_08127 [Trichuris suis]|uniref:Uncharacterized protein n=1 Tax=Trichuris suis TaxID=68888 RepID=A0A085M149_9BILA|nr:hypothetical protein M513_08127 [Trichuris suis]KFD71869.1 hypothetical protein M514_08127 [Trichuris suis]KHJ42972.1 putative UDP-galactose/UDP-N-acetylglucosamine transporter srf-3 [Trichuris suis]
MEHSLPNGSVPKNNHFLFHSYLVCSMIFIWSIHALTLRYTQVYPDQTGQYGSSTVVFLAEMVKLLIAAFLFWREKRFSCKQWWERFSVEVFYSPVEMMKMSVPSICYAVQNNLEFVALSHLKASTFIVVSQLKVVTTAIFMVLILGRKFSFTRWLSIWLVTMGVAAVCSETALQGTLSEPADQKSNENPMLGLIVVMINCTLAGFAGVYCEKMLKETTLSLWMRNMQLYYCGTIFAGITCFAVDGPAVRKFGFFFGYNWKVWLIVSSLCIGGIYVSLVMKYMDNVMKSFAAAFTIITVSLISSWLFSHRLGWTFLVGAITVCGAIGMYNSVPE